jgi:hypothetical protein
LLCQEPESFFHPKFLVSKHASSLLITLLITSNGREEGIFHSL